MLDPGAELPANATIIRVSKPRHAIQNPPVEAFKLRKEIDEKELSFGWLEYFEDCETEYERLGAACTQFARNYSPKREYVLCLDVERARALLKSNRGLSAINIVHSPIRNVVGVKDNPSHAEANGIFPLEEPLQQLAAEQLALAVRKEKQEWRDLLAQGLMPTLSGVGKKGGG